MQKVVTLLLTALLTLTSYAQKDSLKSSYPYFFLTGGATYHTTDVESHAKFGGGLGFGYKFARSLDAPLNLDLRLRWIAVNLNGYNDFMTPEIGNSPALTPYSSTYGYSALNFENKLNQFTLDIGFGFNKLRNRTGLDIYFYGALGFSHVEAFGDLYDTRNGGSTIYAYDDLVADNNVNITSLQEMWDGDYETLLDGQELGGSFEFIPAVGFGLGYQISPGISFGLEHQTSFSLNDYIDGFASNIGGGNDVYHYTGVYLTFNIGRKIRKTKPTPNTYQPTSTPTPTPAPTPKPRDLPPSVRITNPYANNITVGTDYYNIQAEIRNVSSRNQVQFRVNGTINNNFTFTPGNNNFQAGIYLTPGTNIIEVIAQNTAGQASDSRVIILDIPATPPPIVVINNPSSNYTEVYNENYTLTASILNVVSKSEVSVFVNNAPVNFDFIPSTGQVVLPMALVMGNNDVKVRASNNNGSDQKSVRITRLAPQINYPPNVYFVTPNINPFTTEEAKIQVTAQTAYVANQSNVTVTVNGLEVPFIFNPITKEVSFEANLQEGYNTLFVNVTNNYGYKSAQTVVIREVEEVILPPTVRFTLPALQSTSSTVANSNLQAQVSNVASASEITLTRNGLAITNFSFDLNSQRVSFSSALNSGNNVFVITVQNQGGSASDTRQITYIPPRPKNPPIVEFLDPDAPSIVSLVEMLPIQAEVLNVNSKSQIKLVINTQERTDFTFDPVTKLVNFDIVLRNGRNEIFLSAVNQDGSHVDVLQIEYEKKEEVNPPVVEITTPSVSPKTVSFPSYSVLARTEFIGSKNEIQVKVNGLPLAANEFNFNPTTAIIEVPLNLVLGANNVHIQVDNIHGSAYDVTTINYKKRAVQCVAPAIVMNQISNGAVVSDSSIQLSFGVTGIAPANLAVVRLNGIDVSPSQNNTANRTLVNSVTLLEGANLIQVEAENNCGKTVENYTLVYKPIEVVCNKPVVSLVQNGAQNTFEEALNLDFVVASDETPQITAFFNGQSIAHTYDPTSGKVSVNAALSIGQNLIEVKAINSCGEDVGFYRITREVCHLPDVDLAYPTANPYETESPSLNLQVVINRIEDNPANVGVKLNDQPISFTLDPVNDLVNASMDLVEGTNVIIVTATNACGDIVEEFDVVYTPVVVVNPPTVEIQNPVDGSNTETADFIFSAIATNVLSSNAISVLHNGTPILAFDFDANTGAITSQVELTEGINSFKVVVANESGSAEDVAAITYTKPIVILPPTVNFVDPAQENITIEENSYVVHGVATQITAPSELMLMVNGNPYTNFTFNSDSTEARFTFTVNFTYPEERADIQVTATNTSGSASDHVVITYMSRPEPPVVNIVVPSSQNTTTNDSIQNVVAEVLHVEDTSNITVLVNGIVHNNYVYVPNQGRLTFNLDLVEGSNQIKITGTNDSGTASDNAIVTYVPKVIIPQPHVGFTNPVAPGTTIEDSSFIVRASYSHVSNESNISLSLNGQEIPFTANIVTQTLVSDVVLIEGENSFSVTVSNESGSANASTNIIYVVPVQLPDPPTVQFTSPADDFVETEDSLMVITAVTTNITRDEQVVVTLNGNSVNGVEFIPATNQVRFTHVNTTGQQNFVITVTNESGSASDNLEVKYKKPKKDLPPNITILSPNPNPYEAEDSVQSVLAQCVHIPSKSQIRVTVNGVDVEDFDYDTVSRRISFDLALVEGDNYVLIEVWNNRGRRDDNVMIHYTKPVIINPPVVKFTNPTEATLNTDQTNHAITGVVENVSATDQVEVRLDGEVVSANLSVVADGVQFELPITFTLDGSKTITVKGTNEAGTDADNRILHFVAPIPEPTFEIDGSGNVSVTEDVCMTAKVLGEGVIYDSRTEAFVTLEMSFNGGSSWFHYNDGRIVNGGESEKYKVIDGGDVQFRAYCFDENDRWDNTVTSNSTQWVKVLKNGDPVPNISSFNSQTSAEEYIRAYIEDGKVKIGPNDVIYLFELRYVGNYGIDFQDVVLLVTFEPGSGCGSPVNASSGPGSGRGQSTQINSGGGSQPQKTTPKSASPGTTPSSSPSRTTTEPKSPQSNGGVTPQSTTIPRGGTVKPSSTTPKTGGVKPSSSGGGIIPTSAGTTTPRSTQPTSGGGTKPTTPKATSPSTTPRSTTPRSTQPTSGGSTKPTTPKATSPSSPPRSTTPKSGGGTKPSSSTPKPSTPRSTAPPRSTPPSSSTPKPSTPRSTPPKSTNGGKKPTASSSKPKATKPSTPKSTPPRTTSPPKSSSAPKSTPPKSTPPRTTAPKSTNGGKKPTATSSKPKATTPSSSKPSSTTPKPTTPTRSSGGRAMPTTGGGR